MPTNFRAAMEFARKVTSPSSLSWDKILEVTPSMSMKEVIRKAVLMACGQFNYWEGDNGEVTWPGVKSEDWTAVILGKKPIEEMNLVEVRRQIYDRTMRFLRETSSEKPFAIPISDPYWWDALTHVFGGDPLRKRETLLWMMLDYLGYDVPCPQKGCIDYNIIVSLRKHGIVTGYSGNRFNLYQETCLRMDCLEAIEAILDRYEDTFSIASLDAALYLEGRRIRKEEKNWEQYFCYRPGCFFY